MWQKTHELVLLTYKLTKTFPSDERFGLTSQMRRASVSTGSNIVEGFKRRSVKDSLLFYNNADASLEELKYQYLVAEDLGYLVETENRRAAELCDHVGKLLYSWCASQRENAKT